MRPKHTSFKLGVKCHCCSGRGFLVDHGRKRECIFCLGTGMFWRLKVWQVVCAFLVTYLVWASL